MGELTAKRNIFPVNGWQGGTRFVEAPLELRRDTCISVLVHIPEGRIFEIQLDADQADDLASWLQAFAKGHREHYDTDKGN